MQWTTGREKEIWVVGKEVPPSQRSPPGPHLPPLTYGLSDANVWFKTPQNKLRSTISQEIEGINLRGTQEFHFKYLYSFSSCWKSLLCKVILFFQTPLIVQQFSLSQNYGGQPLGIYHHSYLDHWKVKFISQRHTGHQEGSMVYAHNLILKPFLGRWGDWNLLLAETQAVILHKVAVQHQHHASSVPLSLWLKQDDFLRTNRFFLKKKFKNK